MGGGVRVHAALCVVGEELVTLFLTIRVGPGATSPPLALVGLLHRLDWPLTCGDHPVSAS